MWTRTLTRLFFAVAAISLAVTVGAASKANPRKGKAYFKKYCRTCHDGKTAGAPMLQPAELIMDQWERAFEDEEGVAECVPRIKNATGDDLTEQDLLDIKQYLLDGAADGERPMTCG